MEEDLKQFYISLMDKHLVKEDLKQLCKEYHPDIEVVGDGNVDIGHCLLDKIKQQEELIREADLGSKLRKKRTPGRDYYVPKFVYEVKDWIKNYCKIYNKHLPKNFYNMKEKQLYAIYFNLMA